MARQAAGGGMPQAGNGVVGSGGSVVGTGVGASEVELVPSLNRYVRSTLVKGENGNFSECLADLVALKDLDDKPSHDRALAALQRMAQFGYLPVPAVQPLLAALRLDSGTAKREDTAVSRLLQYLVQLALGDGAAGTPIPPGATPVPAQLPKAVDRYSPELLSQAWSELAGERTSFANKQAALRALAALTHASLTSKPDDVTYVGGLFVTLQSLLERIENQRQEAATANRSLASFLGGGDRTSGAGGKKKSAVVEYKSRMEMSGLLRLALSAARVALSKSGIVQVAARSFAGVTSGDALCARHALALASLVAADREGAQLFIGEIGPLLAQNVAHAQRTGLLHVAASTKPTSIVGAAPPVVRDNPENALNLKDPWARVYLARGCAAAIQSGYISGDIENSGAVFWAALCAMAAYDPWDMVSLEATRAMFGAQPPRGGPLRNDRRPTPGPASVEHDAEAQQSKVFGASWHLVMTQADAEPPCADPKSPGGDGRSSAGKLQTLRSSEPGSYSKASPMKAALAVPGSAAAETAAAAAADKRTSAAGATERTLFGCITQRLLTGLNGRSRSALVGALRTLGVMAEARAWCSAMAGYQYEGESDAVCAVMRKLQVVASLVLADASLSASEREAAAEALVWLQEPGSPALLNPGMLVKCAGQGGLTAIPLVRVFADPWGRPHVSSLLHTLQRRMRCTAALTDTVLDLAGALVAGSPGGTPVEGLQQLWDAAPGASGVRACLELLSCPLPPVTQPMAMAVVEAKVMACQQEAALNALKCLAAWWLGEHINHTAGEYSWTIRSTGSGVALPAGLTTPPAEAAGERLAVAAILQNPLLSAAISHLQRLLLTGHHELRTAAALALAKIAVRSNEPYRIQCYSLLSACRHMAAAEPQGASSAVGSSIGRIDALGLGPVVAPALEILDAMYAGEMVVAAGVAQHGKKPGTWPAPTLASLTRRHEWLLTAIGSRICQMPKEVFFPLGPLSRALLLPEEEEKREAEELAAAAAAVQEAAAAATAAAGVPAAASEEGAGVEATAAATAPAADAPFNALTAAAAAAAVAAKARAEQQYGDYYDSYDDDEVEDRQDSYGYGQDPLSRYQAGSVNAPAAVQVQWGNYDRASERGRGDDASDISGSEARYGQVLYDFNPESEDEVLVYTGERVRVLHDLGDWLQVTSPRGESGLVPASYIALEETLYGGSSADASRQPSLALSTSANTAYGGYGGGGYDQSSTQNYTDNGGGYDAFGDGTDAGARGTGSRSAFAPPPLTSMASNASDLTPNPSGNFASRAGSMFGRQLSNASSFAGTSGGGAVRSGFDDDSPFGQPTSTLGTSAPSSPITFRAAPHLDAVTHQASLSSVGSMRSNASVVQASRPSVDLTSAGSSRRGTLEVVAGSGVPVAVSGPSALVLYDFIAELQGELSVAQGDQVAVVREVDEEGWCGVTRLSDGASGAVPASYLQIEE